MAEPHRTASGVITESPLVLVDLETSEGTVGHALVFTYSAAALKPVADLVTNLEPLVKGQPLAPAAITQQLLARFRLLGTHGLMGMAISAIDMAAWDALARMQEIAAVPVARRHATPNACLRRHRLRRGAAMRAGGESWAKRGFGGVKAKIGYPSVEEDVAVVRAMRSAVGPEVAVMVDYNQSLTAVEARRRVTRLDAEGLGWVEEPVDRGGLRRHGGGGARGAHADPGRRELVGPARVREGDRRAGDRLAHARRDEGLRRDRLDAGRGARRCARPSRLVPSLLRGERAAARRHAHRRTGSNTPTGGTPCSPSRSRFATAWRFPPSVPAAACDWK